MRPIMPATRVRHIESILKIPPYSEHEPAGCPEEFAIDLLSDLIHYCEAHKVDFGSLFETAQTHYVAEIQLAAREASLLAAIERRYRNAAITWLAEFSGLDVDDTPLMADAIEDYLTDENFLERHGVPTGLSADALAWVRELAIKTLC